MPRQYNETKTAYKFEELNETAKHKVLEYFASHAFDDSNSWEYIYEDAKTVASKMGLDIDDISFSGFYSQGDGASFTGSCRYAKGGAKAVADYASKDEEIKRIAKELQEVQRRNFYSLYATISQSRGNNIRVSVEDSENPYRDIGTAEDDIAELMNDFAHWIYSRLEQAYEWETSEEYILETIEANGYEFDEDGEMI